MKALQILAGPAARERLRERGLQPSDIRAIPAAAGGPKGLILNPGSDYSTGALNGALVSLNKDRADAQLVRG
mgnify:CR=1 FL=1